MHVIKRLDQSRGYVSKSGRKTSYTNVVKHMRKYKTYDEAKQDCCDNETPISIQDVID